MNSKKCLEFGIFFAIIRGLGLSLIANWLITNSLLVFLISQEYVKMLFFPSSRYIIFQHMHEKVRLLLGFDHFSEKGAIPGFQGKFHIMIF